MSKIKVERVIYGSLDHVVGDGVVAYSSGVSRKAELFKRLFDSTANKQLSKDYASLLLFLNPDQETYSCAHIQGSHVEFPADGRSYCTRCVYEFEAHHLETYGFIPIIQSLPRMVHRQETDFEVSPDIDICQAKQTFESLDENGQNLFHLINHAILNGQQVFIRIDTQSEEYLENHLFESTKLKTLLNVFDCLPERLKKYVSLTFSTDACVNQIVSQIVNPLIIVHHDNISNWNTEDGIIVNWGTDAITCPEEYKESSKYIQEICEIPLISDYMAKPDYEPSDYNVFGWIGSMRTHLDLAIDSDQPDDGDVTLMDLAYESCKSKQAYRHYDMASRLYYLIIQDRQCTEGLKVTMKRLVDDYPELGEPSTQKTDFYKQKIHHAESLSELERLLSGYPITDQIIAILSDFFKEHNNIIEEYMNGTDKYPLIKKLCHDDIITIIKEESLEYILSHKYQDNSSISFTLENIKPKVNSWESLCRACQIIGYSYATKLIEDNEWQVSSLDELNNDINYYRIIQKNKEQVEVKALFAKQAQELLLQQNLTLASLCDIIRHYDGFLLEFVEWMSLNISDYGQDADKKLKYLKKSPYYQMLLSIKEDLDKKRPITTTEEHGDGGKEGTPEAIVAKKEGEKAEEEQHPRFSLVRFLKIYHIDYILIALCAVLLTYLAITLPKEKDNLSKTEQVVDSNLPIAHPIIDTLFIDADIPAGKIERTTLARISNRVLKRCHFPTETVPPTILCLHTEDKEIQFDIYHNKGGDLDSIYSLFGKTLTSGKYSLKDTITASINGRDSVFIVDKKYRFYDQIKGCKGVIKSMIVTNDTKKDTIVFDNHLFKQAYQVEADFEQVLYFFHFVNTIESWRDKNDSKDNLNY